MWSSDGPRGSGGLAGGRHELHEAFLAGFVLVQHAGDGAFEDGVDPVREAQQLGQFRGNDDDALALVGQLLDDAVDLVLGADVDPAGGLVQDQQRPGSVNIHFASTTFCWLPPESLATPSSTEGALVRSDLRYSSATVNSWLASTTLCLLILLQVRGDRGGLDVVQQVQPQ